VVQGKDGDVLKRQTMKVLKPTDADAMAGFLDSKGKPAYMNPATSASKAVVIIPAKGPTGVLNGMIVLDNGVGLAAGVTYGILRTFEKSGFSVCCTWDQQRTVPTKGEPRR